FSGLTIGIFRDGEELIPMVARAPADERLDVDKIRDVQIWSPVAGTTIPLRQVVSGFTTEWEGGIVARRDAQSMIAAQANAIGNATDLFRRLRPRIEAVVIPRGPPSNGAVSTRTRPTLRPRWRASCRRR